MVLGRLLLSLLATLVLVTTANASSAASAAAPAGLRAFLFRADEPLRREFARTPAFAWSPVSGAVKYEFELSTSNAFRDNGLIFADRELKTPVAALQLTLPWITGSPYSLYARVRAVLRSGATAWSKPFGFNLRQPDVPRPLPSYPGLLRWTPIEGSGGYEVWLIDVDKKVIVHSNVLDQREVYTFHQSDPWISNVRWRIRSGRWDVTSDDAQRANGMPITSFGPWSPVYESKNPPLDTGSLRLVGTVSDVVARGASSDPAHRLMPAFVFSGTKGLDGRDAELFRAYVFTDRDCLNRVFTGSIVGSPSFAGRPYGPLSLPRSASALQASRGAYVPDGDQGTTYTQDGEPVALTESASQATPTTSLPGAQTAAPPAAGSTPAPGSSSGAVSFLKVEGNLGAPVDLWDTNWPEGGYYWTVVPVDAVSATSVATVLVDAVAAGASSITVEQAGGFGAGDVIQIGAAAGNETARIATVSGNVITLTQPLGNAHMILAAVTRTGGTTTYIDRELPQEACAAGRVMRFGKSSEPALVSAGTPFASGLSPKGRLTTATGGSSSFYSSPLVAWTPSLGADAYHVQWSKKRAPFKPVDVSWKDKGVASGFLTFANSAVLPLQPGTWWYRVRGVSFRLPTNAQFMAWSDPARIVVSKPTFTVAKPKPKKKTR
jgi:hypothetical protein